LFNDAVTISDYITSNGDDESIVQEDLEGSGCALIEVKYRHLPGVIEENHANPQ
jgi:hypothetical protein